MSNRQIKKRGIFNDMWQLLIGLFVDSEEESNNDNSRDEINSTLCTASVGITEAERLPNEKMYNGYDLDIRHIAYELYKIDWEHTHGICGKRKLKAYRDYTHEKYINCDQEGLSQYIEFKHYIEDIGYGGEFYASYDEFLKSEYINKEYMYYLLEDPELIKAYQFNIIKEAMRIAGWQLREKYKKKTVWEYISTHEERNELLCSTDESTYMANLNFYTYEEIQAYLEKVIFTNSEKEERFIQLVAVNKVEP